MNNVIFCHLIYFSYFQYQCCCLAFIVFILQIVIMIIMVIFLWCHLLVTSKALLLDLGCIMYCVIACTNLF